MPVLCPRGCLPPAVPTGHGWCLRILAKTLENFGPHFAAKEVYEREAFCSRLHSQRAAEAVGVRGVTPKLNLK